MADIKRLKQAITSLKSDGKIKGQGDIARETGYAYSTISEIRNGKQSLSPKFIKIFSEKFGINNDWLNGGTGQMFSIEPNSPVILTSKTSTDMDAKLISEFLAIIKSQQEDIHELVKKIPDANPSGTDLGEGLDKLASNG